ncbi:preprotein translocase subunit SecA [Fluviibacter phosphoraccumulans]|uniref:Protein translocase subunit SecA n=1 Tax=Fluviibacter phosphoraccumulans TaxID=1751046 RepID=A0A7R6TLW9_9RHOO|nr:preprotein translocase subunit SecA [Fluviibacter phosphoraccumulans]BBU67927.1 protein translocase subunit SecA [Fluviibacter phosphoraccumulans]BBU70534.1 protein translocase subunit SecA [Fluviibacter phosphoraccumulans]
MISGLLKSLFGSRNDRLLKTYRKQVERVNAHEPAMEALSDEALQAKTTEFRTRLAGGETLDALLPEAFAVVREASKRVLGMRHFDVQLVGGMVLHYGKIAEMRTGEGKTLVSTLPAYLNALAGKGVHVVTVNDYLARRDAEWMGRLHRWLGLDVGCNLSQMSSAEKRAAYASDITYGTNNEFGFDYLRDNMVYDVQDRVQRKLHYAIVDEVDSILIDEARTPLIISGQAEDHTELYIRMNALAPSLTRCETEDGPGDFWVDEKANQILLTEEGHESAERILTEAGLLAEGHSLYEAANILLMHHLTTALRAHHLFNRDQQYVVQNDEVVIVDEFTGRLMSGRRWSDGLHQAVEAKEGVAIQHENQTLASITFQNYFRMYGKLSGMTGTADTEAYEFQQIYGLETVVIPTHRPAVRKDQQDQIYRTEQEKFNAIVADIRKQHEAGRPILVGTTSIENSELLSALLKREKLEHQVLNAKQHEREAEIVAQAGKPGVITIATNMAGRGTDIVLGGNISKHVDAIHADESLSADAKEQKIAALRAEWQKTHDAVIAAGGLHIIGSERHESRRIDNQLRGRAGRQGDAGSSRFFLSLDDSLLRIFAGDRIKAIMDRLKMPEGEPIEHAIVTRSLESAQRKVEGRNFDIRKQLLEYDNVANDQRRVIYTQRNELLETAEISATMTALRHGLLEEVFRTYVPEGSIDEQWDLPALEHLLESEYQLRVPLTEIAQGADTPDDEALLARLIAAADEVYGAKVALVGEESFSGFERSVMLQSLDSHWREHLSALDHLRQGIHLRGYAQKDPKQEYKREAFELFDSLLSAVRREVSRILMTVRIGSPEEIDAAAEATSAPENVAYQHGEPGAFVDQDGNPYDPETINRNAPCPCGSGEKFKFCHGRVL